MSLSQSRPARLLVFPLLAVALALPATSLAWFDGLPFAAGLETLGVAILLPVLCARTLRERWLGLLGARLLPWLVAGLLLVIGAKATLLIWGEPAGWRGCYTWRLVGPPPLGACEVSYDNPLQRFGATRLDRTIDFGRRSIGAGRLVTPPFFRYGLFSGGIATTNWNFSFLNSLRFNFYEEDGTTERLPFAATWRGAIASATPTVVRVDYIGEGRLRVDAQEIALPSSYDRPGRVELAVPAGRQSMELRYVFDDGGRQGHGAPPLGRQAELHVMRAASADAGVVGSRVGSGGVADDGGAASEARGPGAGGAAATGAGAASGAAAAGVVAEARGSRDARDAAFEPLRTAPAPIVWRALAWLVDGGLLLVIASVLACYARYAWFRLFALVALGIGTLAWAAPSAIVSLPGELFLLAPCALMIAMLARPDWRSGAAAFAILLVVHALRTYHDHPELSTVLYRAAGLDWLGYEGFARTILEARTLEGGEPLFYYQPGWRYLLVALRLVWGDNDILLSTFHGVALTWGIFYAFIRFAGVQRLTATAGSAVLALAALLLVVLANVEWVVNMMRVSASETATWLLLAPMAALLFAPRGARDLWWGSVLAGLTMFTRLPTLLGVAWALAISAARRAVRSPRTLLLIALPPLLVVLAILLHNYAYGGRLTIAPTSAQIPQNVNLYIKDIVSQPVTKTLPVLGYQLRMMLFLPPNYEWPLALPPIGWAMLLAWGWTLAMPFARRRARPARLWAVLLWPLGYLLPFLSWNAANYYPRQILIGYLAMGVSIMAVVSEETPGMPETS